MKVQKAGVVGLGTMGSNIAIVCARGGKETVVYEADAQAMEAGMGRVRAFLDAGVEKGKTSPEERDAMLGRITQADSLTGLEDCDLVIEAITEDREEKNKLLGSLNAVLGESAIIASNTSTLSISHMGAASGRPANTIGTHFCLPAALNKLVEVVPGLLTSDETTAATSAFLEEVGQTPVTVKDWPGFVLNYFLVAFQNDCIRLDRIGLHEPGGPGRRRALGPRLQDGPHAPARHRGARHPPHGLALDVRTTEGPALHSPAAGGPHDRRGPPGREDGQGVLHV